MQWFWCLEHKRVEQDFGCGSTTRIGPYDTEAEAATALQRTRQRKAQQEVRDAEENKNWGKRR